MSTPPPEHSPPTQEAMTNELSDKLLRELRKELAWQADRKWAHPDLSDKYKQWSEALYFIRQRLLKYELQETRRLKDLAVKQQDYERACQHRDRIDEIKLELEK